MDVEVVFAGIPVADLHAVLPWYERLLGRPADIVVKADEVMWRLTDTAWVYVVEDTARAGSGLLAIAVTDLDAALFEIDERGIESPTVQLEAPEARKAPFTDPDGNTGALIEVRSSTD